MADINIDDAKARLMSLGFKRDNLTDDEKKEKDKLRSQLDKQIQSDKTQMRSENRNPTPKKSANY